MLRKLGTLVALSGVLGLACGGDGSGIITTPVDAGAGGFDAAMGQLDASSGDRKSTRL